MDPLDAEDLAEAGLDLLDPTSTRRGSRQDKAPSVGFVGSTSRVPLPEILKQIADRELSGDLQFVSGRAKRTLYFDRGFIVYAGSNLRRDRLGQRLLKSGRLTQNELDMAVRLMEGKKRIGQAMVQAGVLTEEELGVEVARQAKRIVLSSFPLKDSVYSFDQRDCLIPMDLRLGLSVYRIQLEGIRLMTDRKIILLGLGSLDRSVRTAEIAPFTFEESELRLVERQLAKSARKGGTLRRLIDQLDEENGDARQAAYGLLCAGILEYDDGRPKVRKVQEETGAFLLSSLEKTIDTAAATNVRQEVLLQFDSLDQASPDDLLEVDRSADEEEIRRAYQKRNEEWLEKQALVIGEKSLLIKVEEIKRRLALAHARILEERRAKRTFEKSVSPDDDLIRIDFEEEEDLVDEQDSDAVGGDFEKEEKLEFLDEKDSHPTSTDFEEEEELKLVDGEKIDFISDGFNEEEELKLLEEQESALDSNDSEPGELVELVDKQPGAASEAEELSEMKVVFDEAAETEGLPVDLAEQVSGFSSEVAASSEPVYRDEAPKGFGQAAPKAIAEKLKRILYDIKIRRTVSDREGIISLMYEVVELVPQNAKYETMLAEELALHPVLGKRAERHFRRALSFEPQNADIHFRLGRYYQSFNMRSRALAEFKTALRIDPRHPKARSALVELSQTNEKPMGQLFRKFFG